ncbi:MAG: CHASE3 domain-containing protein [Acidobacteriia bacterium]|nr:CHASE3 domain-containing protein [Terriglobia bacterium]
MGGRIRLWMIAASSVGLVALGAVSWLSYRSTQELIAANQRLVQAHKLIEDLTALHVLLDDAESNCRGYALSGKADYLRPYDDALAQLDVTMQVLRHDLAPDRDRSRQVQELEPVIQARLDVMKELVQARTEGGFDAAVRIVRSDRGKRLSDEIRQQIAVVQNEERNDLLDRERESRERARSTILAVGLTCLLGIALLLAASIVIYRLNRQSEKDHVALQNAERIQRTILNSAAYSMISTDTAGVIQTVNAAAEKWLQYKGAELIGSNVSSVHDTSELQSRGEQLTRAMGMPVPGDYQALVTKARYGVADEFECSYVRKDGTRFPVLLAVTALGGGGNDLAGYLMISADLSEQHAMRKMKDEFVSIVSHELRTPLTSIKGALGLLARGVTGALPPKAGEMAHIALTNADRLSRLVDDILDLQRIESGRIAMDKRTCDIAHLMKQSVESVHLVAEGEGITIAISHCQASIKADRERMVQAFVNLLGNAIKFSRRGNGIEFAAERSGSSVIFRVRDEGRGIPKDKLERIFERFEQVDASDAREKGGTGLGLAICRSIVEQHGGRVWAESELGRGSTFYVQLPLAEAEAVAAN